MYRPSSKCRNRRVRCSTACADYGIPKASSRCDISPYLHISPHISTHLAQISPHISPDLTRPHHVSPNLPDISPQLWPFYGASESSLLDVSEALTPDVAFEGTLLCEPPMDPCTTLTIVVHGKIGLVRAPPPGGNPDGQTESAGVGAMFGEFEFLPDAPPNSIEEIILSKQVRSPTI